MPFMNKCNWEGKNYPLKIASLIRRNNPTIAVNILYTKEKDMLPAYISNHNSTREK